MNYSWARDCLCDPHFIVTIMEGRLGMDSALLIIGPQQHN